MCRLYAFRSTENTKVECTLVHAQNALMAQSKSDMSGGSHAHGWGLATYEGQTPHIDRQAWAAYHGEHFARAAARVYSTLVIAHVRHATVGGAALANTHPFGDDQFVMAHNGTVPNFQRVRPILLEQIAPEHREVILGETDSEHIFAYALSLMNAFPEWSLKEIVQRIVRDVSDWSYAIDPQAPIGLNLVLTDGDQIAGTRLGRSLFQVSRTGVYDCEICGFPHIHHQPNNEHRAVVVASEPITSESWIEIPERSVWSVDAEAKIDIQPL